MASALYQWAVEERTEITQDLKWFAAGSTLVSPSGDDITEMKIGQLQERLRELDEALRDADSA